MKFEKYEIDTTNYKVKWGILKNFINDEIDYRIKKVNSVEDAVEYIKGSVKWDILNMILDAMADIERTDAEIHERMVTE